MAAVAASFLVLCMTGQSRQYLVTEDAVYEVMKWSDDVPRSWIINDQIKQGACVCVLVCACVCASLSLFLSLSLSLSLSQSDLLL